MGNSAYKHRAEVLSLFWVCIAVPGEGMRTERRDLRGLRRFLTLLSAVMCEVFGTIYLMSPGITWGVIGTVCLFSPVSCDF